MVKVRGIDYQEGCYGDGGLGYDRIREVLADMVKNILEDHQLAEELCAPMSDDDSETLDAIDHLNDVTVNGYWYIGSEGDLFLVETGSELDQWIQGK